MVTITKNGKLFAKITKERFDSIIKPMYDNGKLEVVPGNGYPQAQLFILDGRLIGIITICDMDSSPMCWFLCEELLHDVE